jgi:hypothetical protein
MPILGVVASGISANLDANAMFPIAFLTTTSNATSVTISSIPATYTHLRIFTNVKTSRGAYIDPLSLRFNGDSGSNYSYTGTEFESGVSPAGFHAQSQTKAYFGRGAGTTNASLNGVCVLDIYNYANTNVRKSFNSHGGIDYSAGGNIVVSVGTWQNTAAINSITFLPDVGPNINSPSTFQIYGMK